ncbi:putative dehydrogenase [Caenibius tardaugens NBRC 16725]|uniref:Putative dehydrogenase n=1 Tax=Caenibius tardaugens NBRC 16725 TaxID=1219035 RepID=U2ZU96_9SPHN|nr:sorbosone dehydrogenase family protein [Caenibius tardaugens]AZI35993.1 sorbosone dehydrogenase family protein [Caenibius tardaugens NBRC 16725]GAD48944.1 putative dehydrogenase [Caenibius tardaugens NBRC 16725]
MSTKRKLLIALVVLLIILIAFGAWIRRGDVATLSVDEVSGVKPVLKEDPDAEMIPTVGIAKPIGWPAGAAPTPAQGLKVTRFAEGLKHPRTMLTLPNGDVLVAETSAPPGSSGSGFVGWITGLLMGRAGATVDSANTIVLLRDANGDGTAEARFPLRTDLSSPSGMAWADDKLYVANHDALLVFDYKLGDTTVAGAPRKLMDLPAAGNHWMRNITLRPDGKAIYVAVGSSSNIGENGMDAEQGRAMIWEYDLSGKSQRMFATGLRNPNGLAWSPWTDELWTTVNERDMLGSDLVPDYLTNVPIGAQYGWPWVYWRNKFDRRVQAPPPDFLTEYARKPEYALGPHTAALGLVFSQEGNLMGDRFASGAFIARHGSWNRNPASGYDVVFVKFDARGNPEGKPVPLLTGFLTDKGDTHGRPTWVAWDKAGALLVTDDTAGIVWRVWDPAAKPAAKIVPQKVKSLPPQRELKGDPIEAFKDDFIEKN